MIKKRNSLTVLFIITVVMVLLMLVTIYRTNDDKADYGLLFPSLFDKLSEVDKVRFSSSEDQFTLHRDGEDWFISEHYDYPANFDEVKRMLVDLTEAEILERKTENPDNYPLLGVEGAEPETPGGSSVSVKLMDGDEEVAGLILGNQREGTIETGPKQFYVRRDGEKQTWLAEGYLYINPVMLNWIQSKIVDIARERIARVEIIQPNGDKAEIVNLGKKDQFGTPEAGKKTVFKYPQLGYDIAGSLFQMRMEDVKPIGEFDRGDADVVTARFTSFDGLVITTKTSFIDGFYYTTLSAEFDAAAKQPAPEDIQKLDVMKTPDEVREEVAKLNKRLSPWVYRVSGFVGTNLMRAKSDIVTVKSEAIPMPPDLNGFGPRR
jgi:hypothetical protein